MRETGTKDRQTGSGKPLTSRNAENFDAVNDLALSQQGAPQTHKTTQSPGKLAFSRGQWDASYTHRHSAKVPEETIEAWLGIQQSITDLAINQWLNRLNACGKAKGKHFEHLL